MLPEYIFDTSQLEDNPLTFPEVKTLIDVITICGHKVTPCQLYSKSYKKSIFRAIPTKKNHLFKWLKQFALFHSISQIYISLSE